MNEERIVKYNLDDMPRGNTDWERVDALTDEEIEEAVRSDPDAAPVDPEFWEDFWKNAHMVIPAEKVGIYIRIDGDVLEWFKSHGKGYQTRINAVLRSYVEAQKESRKNASLRRRRVAEQKSDYDSEQR